MIKKIAFIALGVFLFFVGLGLIDVYLSDPEIRSDTSSLVIGMILGIGVGITGIVLTVIHSLDLRDMLREKRGLKNQIAKELRSELCPDFYKITEDKTEFEHLLRSFRKDYADFFSHTGVQENDAIQKDAACKSQAVCAPSFTNCKQCGAPMSLMAGRVCNYCGHARRLAEYDWAIRNYKIL